MYFIDLQGYLVEALRDKMKYLRSFGKPKKVLDSEELDIEPPTKKRKEFKQFPQTYAEPSIPAGEDEDSYRRNQKMLLSEERKINPNKKTISVLMDRTYAFRRHSMLGSPKPLKEVLKIYPSLRRLEQVYINHECCIVFEVFMTVASIRNGTHNYFPIKN